jgi:hypothetical protein
MTILHINQYVEMRTSSGLMGAVGFLITPNTPINPKQHLNLSLITSKSIIPHLN